MQWTGDMMNKEFVEEHERLYGFRVNPINYMQILAMQSQCRATCRQWLEAHPEADIPSALREHDMYRDQVSHLHTVIVGCWLPSYHSPPTTHTKSPALIELL